MKQSLVLLTTLLSLLSLSNSLAQPIAYGDAENRNQAASMMMAYLAMHRTALIQCSKRIPALEGDMHGKLKKWEADERHAIENARSHWAKLLKQEPRLEQTIAFAESSVRREFEAMDDAPAPSVVAKQADIQARCRRYFGDLADGVWRSRTPKLYSFLTGAPALNRSRQ